MRLAGRYQSRGSSDSSRRQPPPAVVSSDSWLTTFADLVTLLLTFLVLMVSITTVDTKSPLVTPDGVLIEKDGQVRLGNGILLFSDLNILLPVADMVKEALRAPENMDLDQDQLKNAIFQLDETNTQDFELLQGAVDEQVEIFQDDRGLVIQWDRNMLFPEGSSAIYEENLLLLQKIAVLLLSLDLPLSIESHTNPLSPLEGNLGPESYKLSFQRSKAVMEYLIGLGVSEKRFRIGAHGGAHPRTLNFDSIKENSRLEIIIYRPSQSSPFGS